MATLGGHSFPRGVWDLTVDGDVRKQSITGHSSRSECTRSIKHMKEFTLAV